MNARDQWRKKAMSTPVIKPSTKELKETFGEKEYERISAIIRKQK